MYPLPKPVELHPSFRQVFGQTNQHIYTARVVLRVTSQERHHKRVLLLTAERVFVCALDGTVRRVFPVEQVREACSIGDDVLLMMVNPDDEPSLLITELRADPRNAGMPLFLDALKACWAHAVGRPLQMAAVMPGTRLVDLASFGRGGAYRSPRRVLQEMHPGHDVQGCLASPSATNSEISVHHDAAGTTQAVPQTLGQGSASSKHTPQPLRPPAAQARIELPPQRRGSKLSDYDTGAVLGTPAAPPAELGELQRRLEEHAAELRQLRQLNDAQAAEVREVRSRNDGQAVELAEVRRRNEELRRLQEEAEHRQGAERAEQQRLLQDLRREHAEMQRLAEEVRARMQQAPPTPAPAPLGPAAPLLAPPRPAPQVQAQLPPQAQPPPSPCSPSLRQQPYGTQVSDEELAWSRAAISLAEGQLSDALGRLDNLEGANYLGQGSPAPGQRPGQPGAHQPPPAELVALLEQLQTAAARSYNLLQLVSMRTAAAHQGRAACGSRMPSPPPRGPPERAAHTPAPQPLYRTPASPPVFAPPPNQWPVMRCAGFSPVYAAE